jgi:hypothetical protein
MDAEVWHPTVFTHNRDHITTAADQRVSPIFLKSRDQSHVV